MGKRRALLIMGMHRSGTSALSRVLSLRGADLPAHLMDANFGNTTGYWESAPVVAFNDSLLDFFGVDWDDPFAVFQIAEPSAIPARFTQGALELVQSEFGDSRLMVLKDPRMTLLCEFWISALRQGGIDACPVTIMRPCAQVAASLKRRDHAVPENAILLYVAYGIQAAVGLQGTSPVALTYDALLEDWRVQTDRIAGAFGFTWPRSGAYMEVEVARFLNPASASGVLPAVSPTLSAWAETVWEWHRRAASGERPDLEPLLRVRAALAEASGSFSPLLAERRRRLVDAREKTISVHEQTGEQMGKLAVERDTLRAERDRALSVHSETETELRRTQQAFQSLSEEAKRLAGEIEASAESELTSVRKQAEALVAERDTLRVERDRALSVQSETETELRRTQQAFQSLSEETKRHAAEMESSTESELTSARKQAEALVAERDTLRVERDRALSVQSETEAELQRTQQAFGSLSEQASQDAARMQALVARLQREHEAIGLAYDELVSEHDRSLDEYRSGRIALEAASRARDEALVQLDAKTAELDSNLSALRNVELERAVLVERSTTTAQRLADAVSELADLRVAAEHHAREMATARLALLEAGNRIEQAASVQRRLEADVQAGARERAALHGELRRAQANIDKLEASHSWRITAPLRSISIVGRRFLQASARTLRAPQLLLPHFPAEAPDGSATASIIPAAPRPLLPEPSYTRRKHPGLRAFLAAEFNEQVAADVLLRIDRYRLPIPREQARAATAVECSADEASYWVTSIAQRAAALVDGQDRVPDVSIVVPVYNQLPFTLACLESLLGHRSRYHFEILVGDDASSDGTEAALAVPIPGVQHVRHTQNLGFVRNCNATAALARGRHVVMLNNDTIVLPGWLDELIDVLEGNDSVGLVGSKLVYPDGRLQECGGIVWRDGSAWNFGRLDDPRRPEHNYLRGADFVSGASIAVPTALWRQLGGFDEHFAPAYAEDVDLAFRIRDLGLYTLVQPLSQLLHFEGISNGTDLGQGAKASQVENLRKLHARWEHVLGKHRQNAEAPELEKERDTARRLLFVDHCTLTPNEDAGSLVAFEIMKSFRRMGYKVTFIPEDNFAHMGEDTRVLQRLGVETIYHPSYSRMEQFLAARSDSFDLVLLHRFTVGDRHMAALKAKFPEARFVFLACDLHYLRELREAELGGDVDAVGRAGDTRRRELAVAGESDAVVVYSEAERDLIAEALPGKHVVLFPLVHDPVLHPSPLHAREGVCFVGGYRHPPNADAIGWFARDVWPLVRARCPDARLHVAGSHMTEQVKALVAFAGVEIVGFVPHLESFLSQRRVNIAPLRFGAGVKGKVAAALANGLPTVGTSIAAEGMQLQPGHDILVADDAQAFADAVIVLLRDDARWSEVSHAGIDFAARVTSSASAQLRIREMLDALQLQDPA